MTHDKKREIILRQRAIRQRKRQISAARRMKAHTLARILRRRSRLKERARARFWREKLGKTRPRTIIKQDKQGQILGFPVDLNLKSNPAVQYFSKIMELFKDRLPSEVFSRL